ncbi:MAG: DUF481 domain-containing protein [Myxococcota bacterium]|nr:DUF481 domain-containing protein [Myxococcales bacterium]
MPIARFALGALLALALALPSFAEEEAAPAEDPGWTGKISLGGNISSGTINSYGGTIDAGTENSWGPHNVKLGAFANYSHNDGGKKDSAVTTANEQRLTQYYRFIPSDSWYWYGNLEQARDTVRNIELRLLANTGPGYRFWHADDKNLFEAEAGVGYRYEDYGDVPGNIPERSRNDVNGRVAANFLRVFGIAEFGQSAEFLLPFNDTSGWIARGTTRLSFPIASGWSFANTLALEYFNTPPSGSKSFELDYIISLVYAF